MERKVRKVRIKMKSENNKSIFLILCSTLNICDHIHTHREADDLVVTGRFRLFHRLHEGPGILVTLRHKDQRGKNECARVCV